jgi:hypothetical protein
MPGEGALRCCNCTLKECVPTQQTAEKEEMLQRKKQKPPQKWCGRKALL